MYLQDIILALLPRDLRSVDLLLATLPNLQTCKVWTFNNMKKHASPAKVVRSYRRLLNFLLRKPKSHLSIECLPTVDFLPKPKILSCSLVTSNSIPARSRKISIMKNESVSIPAYPKQMTSTENQELVSKLENVQS